MTIHRQARIEYDGRSADVDQAIAPLILELWRAGIATSMSCEDRNGCVWIAFTTALDAQAFLALNGEPERWQVHPRGTWPNLWHHGLNVSVLFPLSEYDEVLARLRRKARRR